MDSGLNKKMVDMINAHPLIIIGTCDRALVPATSRGFGVRLNAERTAMDVLVTRWPSPQTRTNIELTGRVAVTFTDPETYVSYQIKGKGASCLEVNPDDLGLADAYCKAIGSRLIAIGAPANVVGLIYMAKNIFRVTCTIESLFLQTPGKDAGRKL
jgi:hypothetical protein